jgi:hypothetical protein
MEPAVKLKRGRKPKPLDENSKPIEKKKRGRKPSCQIFEMKEIDNMISNLPTECIIAHLPLFHDDIENVIDDNFTDVLVDETNKTVNLGFELDKSENYNCGISCTNCNELNTKIEMLTKKLDELTGIINNSVISRSKIIENTIHIENYYVENLDSDKTCNICCWWCCNNFDSLPIGLPFKFYNNIFYVYGFFCSFNCCLAYNYSLNDYNIWERTTLLYNYKNKIIPIKDNKIIKAAPPKEILQQFGGLIKITEFRNNTIILKKNYRLNIPVTISIRSTIEETDDTNESNFYTRLNLNTNNDTKLILKRTKAVQKNNSKKSLLTMMNIDV